MKNNNNKKIGKILVLTGIVTSIAPLVTISAIAYSNEGRTLSTIGGIGNVLFFVGLSIIVIGELIKRRQVDE